MATPFDVTPYARRTTAVAPAAPSLAETLKPSSTEITYGFGSEPFLTDKQQQISDSVQHSFANSLAQRDRDLQRYQMPQLASFTEDEALARAIATANLANQPANPYGIPTSRGGGGGGGRGGGGGGYSAPRTAATAAPRAAASTPWYSYLAPAMQGIAAVAPWLLGRDTLDQIAKQGVFGWLKNSDGSVTPVDQNGQPVYGAQSGWGQDVIQTNPYPNEGYYTDQSWGQDVLQYPAPIPASDYGGGDIADWSNWTPPPDVGYMPDWGYWG